VRSLWCKGCEAQIYPVFLSPSSEILISLPISFSWTLICNFQFEGDCDPPLLHHYEVCNKTLLKVAPRWHQQQMQARAEVAKATTGGGCKGSTRRQLIKCLERLCISSCQSYFLSTDLDHNLTLGTRHYVRISSTRALTILSQKVCFKVSTSNWYSDFIYNNRKGSQVGFWGRSETINLNVCQVSWKKTGYILLGWWWLTGGH